MMRCEDAPEASYIGKVFSKKVRSGVSYKADTDVLYGTDRRDGSLKQPENG